MSDKIKHNPIPYDRYMEIRIRAVHMDRWVKDCPATCCPNKDFYEDYLILFNSHEQLLKEIGLDE